MRHPPRTLGALTRFLPSLPSSLSWSLRCTHTFSPLTPRRVYDTQPAKPQPWRNTALTLIKEKEKTQITNIRNQRGGLLQPWQALRPVCSAASMGWMKRERHKSTKSNQSVFTGIERFNKWMTHSANQVSLCVESYG